MTTLPAHFSFVRATILIAVCLMASKVHAAVDAFIWFDSTAGTGVEIIKGQSLDVVFPGKNGWSELKDFSFGVENPTTIGSATGGAGAGKIKFNEFTIKKTTDKASPAFFKNCCTGSHYTRVFIAMRKAGGDPTATGKPFLTFQFETVFTTKIDWSGPGDEGPEESITFVYGKLGVTYFPQDAAGTPGDPISQGWDQIQNINFLPDPDPLRPR